jgi:hypothetical protein
MVSEDSTSRAIVLPVRLDENQRWNRSVIVKEYTRLYEYLHLCLSSTEVESWVAHDLPEVSCPPREVGTKSALKLVSRVRSCSGSSDDSDRRRRLCRRVFKEQEKVP